MFSLGEYVDMYVHTLYMVFGFYNGYANGATVPTTATFIYQ